MGITSIVRDWGDQPCIVRVQTTDSTATALSTGYITAQAVNIATANNASAAQPFQWQAGDCVLLYASDGDTLCTLDASFTSLFAYQGGAGGYVITPITLAAFLASYTTPVLVVPAPGANQMLIVDSAQIVQIYGSAALAGGGATNLQYGSATHGGGVAASTAVAAADLQQTASTVYPMIGVSGSGKYMPDSTCAGVGLYISNPTAVFTGGTASTFFVKTKFHTINTLS